MERTQERCVLLKRTDAQPWIRAINDKLKMEFHGNSGFQTKLLTGSGVKLPPEPGVFENWAREAWMFVYGKSTNNIVLEDTLTPKPNRGPKINSVLLWRMQSLKGQCHKIFLPLFFHESSPSGPLINRQKMFFLKNSFWQRYWNLKFEKFDSAQANSARSQKFLTS